MSSPSTAAAAKKRRIDTTATAISSGRSADADTTSVSDGSGRATGGLVDAAAAPKADDSHAVLTCGLSPELWGRILDFLLYSDLRSVLPVCRSMALEASGHVNVLNITRPRQLNVAAARRFPNVTKMGMYCLVRCFLDSAADMRHVLEADAIGGIIPFLMCFPKLRYVFVGGLQLNRTRNEYVWFGYCSSSCYGPSDHAALYRGLVYSFCGAFQHRALSSALCLDGLLSYWKQITCTPPVESADEPCSLCRRICRTFPLSALIQSFGAREGFPNSDLCIREEELVQIIRTRQWSRECIDNTSDYLLSAPDNCLLCVSVANVSRFRGLSARLTEKGTLHPGWLFFLPDRMLRRLELLIDLGCEVRPFHRGPEDWNKRAMMESLNLSLDSGGYALAKSTFDRLVKIGYQIEESDFVIVDETNEPELRDFDWHEAEKTAYRFFRYDSD